MDETPRQLITETRDVIPPTPGRDARQDYEYRRSGTCNVFMATEPLAGRRLTKVTERRTKADWAHFLDDIADQYSGLPAAGLGAPDPRLAPDHRACQISESGRIRLRTSSRFRSRSDS